ncbi:hypothetical protein, partial [Flintibacter sp.]|uniref:hypothetical protein n=1 Tax=Flintibacter sp. TaxID=1918624 RepID=UPI003D0EB2CD|nr:hypothetical protein [Flintibacter sp.]
LVFWLNEISYRHQWIKLQKIWRSVHFIQSRGHAGQAHFVQFSKKGVNPFHVSGQSRLDGTRQFICTKGEYFLL